VTALYGELSQAVTLPETFHFLIGNELASACLFKTLADRSASVLVEFDDALLSIDQGEKVNRQRVLVFIG